MSLRFISGGILMPILVFAFWQVALINSTTCQEGFKKLIYLPGTKSSNIDDIEYSNCKLIIRGNAYNDSLKLWGLSLLTMDTIGNLLSYNTFFDTTDRRHIVVNSPCRFLITNDNRFVIPATYFDGTDVVLFMTDTMGCEVSRHVYQNTEKTIFVKDIKQIWNSFYILGTIVRNNYLSDIFIIKTDSNGNFIWIKYYGGGAHDKFGDVQIEENGILTISAQVNLSIDEKQPWIFNIDTSGSIVNNWKGDINDIRTKGGGSFFRFDNGDYVITSLETKEVLYAGVEQLFNGPTISILDSNFQLIWKDTLANFTSAWDDLVDLEYDSFRDEFIAAGHRTVIYNPFFGEIEAWVVKFKPDGEVIWSVSDTLVSDPMNGAWHFSSGIVISPSGSIYESGNLETFTNPPNNCGWIIKVTPDGCMDTLCVITSVESSHDLPKVENVNVYPNPVVDQMNISIRDLQGPCNLDLYDLNGRLLFTTKVYQGDNTIPIGLPQGLYFYLVSNAMGIMGSGKIVVR